MDCGLIMLCNNTIHQDKQTKIDMMIRMPTLLRGSLPMRGSIGPRTAAFTAVTVSHRRFMSQQQQQQMQQQQMQQQQNKLKSKSDEPLVAESRLHYFNRPGALGMAVSERAHQRLAEIYRDSHEVLQVGVEAGGCHGYQYWLKLVPDVDLRLWQSAEKMEKKKKVDSNDEIEFDEPEGLDPERTVVMVLPQNKGKIVIDPDSLRILDKATLTYTDELIGSSFKILNGNLKSSCGCGTSFDIET